MMEYVALYSKGITGITLWKGEISSAAFIVVEWSPTQSIFHKLESEYDLISTIKFMKNNWCQDIDVTYAWIKGHAY
jgi:hypothetical protein